MHATSTGLHVEPACRAASLGQRSRRQHAQPASGHARGADVMRSQPWATHHATRRGASLPATATEAADSHGAHAGKRRGSRDNRSRIPGGGQARALALAGTAVALVLGATLVAAGTVVAAGLLALIGAALVTAGLSALAVIVAALAMVVAAGRRSHAHGKRCLLAFVANRHLNNLTGRKLGSHRRVEGERIGVVGRVGIPNS